jgi:hypothetical protein
MRKNVKDFLNYLEKETSITIDFTTASPTRKLRNSIDQPILLVVLGINKGTLGLRVISCGCKNCNKVIGIEILHRGFAGELSNAKRVQNEIMSIVPEIDVAVRNVTYGE